MTIHLTLDVRAVLIGFILLLVTLGIATPIAISLADDGPSAAPPAAVVGTGFTYQGRFEVDGVPASGLYDFRFTLFDDLAPGAPDVQIGTPVTADNVTVTNGLFTVTLDFGAAVFAGSGRWLSLEAKADADPNYATMNPRQPLSPVPYALFSLETAPHDHFGETWTGTGQTGLTVDSTGIGISASGFPNGLVAAEGALAPPTNRRGGIHGYSVTGWGVIGEGAVGLRGIGTDVGLDSFGTNIGIQAQGSLFSGKFTGPVDVVANAPAALNVNNTGTPGNPVAIIGTATGPFGTGLVGQNLAGGEGVVGIGVIDPGLPFSNRLGIGVVGRSYVAGSSPQFQDAFNQGSGVYGEGQTGVSALGSTYGLEAYGAAYGIVAHGQSDGVLARGGRNADGSQSGQRGNGVLGYGAGKGTPAAGLAGFGDSSSAITGGDCDAITNAILSDYCIGVYGEGSGTASIGVAGAGSRIGVYGQSNVGVGFAGFFRGDVVVEGTCYCTLSDGRFKRDIADLGYGVADVMALRPVAYAWKSEEQDDGNRHAGFIAQEAEKVATELVLHPSGDTLYVDPMAFVAMLVNAVQEQQAQITEQAEKIADLQTKALTPQVSAGTVGEGRAGGDGGASLATPNVTVVRQSIGPSNDVLMALTTAIVLFALAVFAHGLISRRKDW